MNNPEFTGATADEVTEKAGLWLHDARKKGAYIPSLCLIVMKRESGEYVASVGSRRMLILQLLAMDPIAAENVARELSAHDDRLPIFGLDMQTKEHGIQWMDPLPNAKGGAA